MMKQFFFSAVATSFLLTACGGGGGGGNDVPRGNTPTEVNVAAQAKGASAIALYNAATAANLIDGNLATSWISDPDSPIIITFSAIENIRKFKLTRTSAAASLGTNPDILIELSANGVDYAASNVSVITGGIACSNMTTNAQVMECSMSELATRYVRITTLNGKSYELGEFEAIAVK